MSDAAGMAWDPEQYLKFEAQRFEPFDDLLAWIDKRPGMRVIDLGCGTGDLTARLASALPGSEVLGIDTSPQMLDRARRHERPGLRFALGDLREVEGSFDLVFSHAAIQWADDHERLVPALWERVAPGGQIAVQIPANHDHFSHVAIRAIASVEPFATALGGWVRESPVLPVERYAEILAACGGSDIRACAKIYPHVLDSADDLLEWTKGTALVPYLERMPEALHEAWLDRYRECLRARFPREPVFYAFKRILFAAKKQ